MEKKKLNVSGTFLRDCISRFNNIRHNHLEAHKYIQVEHLQNVANIYFANFRDDNLNIKTNDTETFAEYIDAFGLEQKDELLDKLQSQVSYNVREYLYASKEKPWWNKVLNKQKEEKNVIIPNFWNRAKNKLKYIIPTALLIIGSAFGLKKDSKVMENQPQTSSINAAKLPNFQRFSMPKPTDYTLDSFIKKAQSEAKKDTTTQEHKALTNFYNHRLAQFLGAKKRDKMLTEMKQQNETGKINLPADISASRYLYAAEIYHQYGYISISKALNDVVTSSKAISPEVQSSLFRYVRLAGKKGVGVQQMRYGKQMKTQAVRS